MRKFISLLIILLVFNESHGQQLLWEKTIGGDDIDWLHHAFQNSRGNYIFSGYSYSSVSGDKTASNKGWGDLWIIETDTEGNILWQETYGGNSSEMASQVLELPDGTYLLAGDSYSSISEDKTEPSRGDRDLWLVKLDENRNIEWQRTYGGNASEDLDDIVITGDGGFLLTCTTRSEASGDKTTPAMGESDIWILKLDPLGRLEWQKNFGGSSEDYGAKIEKKHNGNFIIATSSASGPSMTKEEPSRGLSDFWIFEIDISGNIIWQKTIGGDNGDHLADIKPTPEGGFILGGSSASGISGERSLPVIGFDDHWIIKIDAFGEIQWQKVYGGNSTEWLSTISPSQTSGYLLGGMSGSGVGGDKTEAGRGDRDFWILKISEEGETCWDKTLGANGPDQPQYGFEDRDGNYILAGWTDSGISGDKSGASRGGRDMWITKISQPPVSPPVVNVPEPYEACDNNGDGFAEFDLSSLEKDIIGEDDQLEVNYYNETGKLLPSPFPAEYTNVDKSEEKIRVTVTRKNNACATTTVDILLVVNSDCDKEDNSPPDLTYFPKFFTPNGDGYNDRWGVSENDRKKIKVVHIFDRYGKLLKQLSPEDQWNGEYNGRSMPGDDYWYKAMTAKHEILTGHFSLLR